MPGNNAEEHKLGGNITLVGFKLEPMVLIVVKKIVGNYAKKLGDKGGYKELKVSLRQHEHGKAMLHEIETELITSKNKQGGSEIILNSSAEDYNLFNALSSVMEKLLSEIEKVKQ
jgi:ribosome-associated translation inhibitor RaiA